MSMFPIASTGVLGNVLSYNFTNIPQNFTHLQLRISGRSSNAGVTNAILMQFNGDYLGTNYTTHALYGDGSAAYSANPDLSSTFMQVGVLSGSSATTNVFGGGIVDILDYTSTTKTKTIRYIGGVDNNGSGRAQLGSGFWNISPIAGITTIGLYVANWVAGSRVDLYGIQTSNATGA